MVSPIEKQLNESLRDALVCGYMKFVGPGLLNVGGTPLTNEDLYEYLLLDPEVADDVMTSRVASAIGSLQTYMTRIVNGSEIGFSQVDPSVINEWRANGDQYAVWAAGAEVQNYAENYISPPTRLEKSHYFSELETTLNQNQLNPDTVLDAALAYLNEFEAVSNLTVVSGYIDQQDLGRAIYYFVGHTTTKPYSYYWRTMDLSKNRADYAGKAVTPNCWSDWLPISLPLSSNSVLECTVRPVFYNQRLYVAWVEREPSPQKDDNGNDTQKHVYRMNFGYKRFDDTWTAPNSATMMIPATSGETESSTLVIEEPTGGYQPGDVNLLAITDFTDDGGTQTPNTYGRLMLGMFVRNWAGTPSQNTPAVYGYQYCDSAFDTSTLDDTARNKLFGRFRDKDSTTNTLQCGAYTIYALSNVAAYQSNEQPPGGGDLHGSNKDDESYKDAWWTKIADLQATDTGPSSHIYMSGPSTVTIEMALSGDFMNDFIFDASAITSGGNSGFGFCRPDGEQSAQLRYHQNDTYTFVNTALTYNPTLFGAGSVPNGMWSTAAVYNESGSAVDSGFVFGINDNNINFLGGTYSNKADLSGYALTDYSSYLNYAISKKTLDWFFAIGPSWDQHIANLGGFEQVAETRNFYCEIALVSAAQSTTKTGNMTFELAQGSADATISHAFQISDRDFPAEQPYISVCLTVGDIRINRPDGTYLGGEQVWNWFKVYISPVGPGDSGPLPQIKSNYNSTLGNAQYLDFIDGTLPAKTRLNTTFVRTLIDKASLGLDSLLDYTVQTAKLEAALDGGQPEAMDFNGANGLYFWELFFHMPFLVAWRFGAEQQFDDAQQWLHYIFDPAMANKGATNAPAYWNVYPLTQPGQLSYVPGGPLDPDTLAYAHPVIYEKAVFISYVANLIAQGDSWYRQLTRDGLTQARVFYNLAAELLGPRPDLTLSSSWTAKTLDTLASTTNTALRDFEASLGDVAQAGILALPGQHIGHLQLNDNGSFVAPLNSLLLTHWDTLDSRLYNLRNGLTVDGNPVSLPLYEPPEDPTELLTQRAQSGTLVRGMSGAQLAIPPYRFSAILPRAYDAVATLSAFGEQLLSLIERGESANIQELQQQQSLHMSSYAITLQNQAIEGLNKDMDALKANKTVAKDRHDAYEALYNENISADEQSVMDTHAEAQTLMVGAQGVTTASGALKLLPNLFGMADGGMRLEGATQAVADVLSIKAQVKQISSDRTATSEGYRRRQEDWKLQADQANDEVTAFDAQIKALTVRQSAANTELKRLKAQHKSIKKISKFMRGRFTQSALYRWLVGQQASLYCQIYDIVAAQCLAVQACWQYELGDLETTFIQTGAWNDRYRGLLVGRTLHQNLRQMEAAYLSRHERRLEITRTVSLARVLSAQTKYSSFTDQKTTGTISFDLDESLYDQDYPGHYMRQIKSVWISLPTLLGPYQDIKASLTQISSSTLLNASVDGVKYLNGTNTSIGSAVIVRNLRAGEQIALSSGLNDAGLFELRFDDERYLPFEGTGAVSSWTLTFPRHDKSNMQKAMLNTLTDVIVHVRYTALDGGTDFAAAVDGLGKS